MKPETEIVLPFELSDAELDAVHGGHGPTIVGGQLVAMLAQVLHGHHSFGGGLTQISFNIAAGNVTGGNFNQTTGDQIIAIG